MYNSNRKKKSLEVLKEQYNKNHPIRVHTTLTLAL